MHVQPTDNLSLRQNEPDTSSTAAATDSSGISAKSTCPICKIDFLDEQLFGTHLNKQHPKCHLCGKYLRTEQFLLMHLATIHNINNQQ